MDEHKELNEWTSDTNNQKVSKPLKISLLVFCFFFWILGALFASIGGLQMSLTPGKNTRFYMNLYILSDARCY